MSEQHAPEPWAIDQDDRPHMEWNNHIVARNNPNIAVCFMTHDGTPENEEGEANARRIVACVNACAGITTDDLELCPVGGLLHLAASANQLVKQRAELLAAAEAIEIDAEECLDFDECTAMLVPIDTYNKLTEAIASVKGGAA